MPNHIFYFGQFLIPAAVPSVDSNVKPRTGGSNVPTTSFTTPSTQIADVLFSLIYKTDSRSPTVTDGSKRKYIATVQTLKNHASNETVMLHVSLYHNVT